MIIERLDGTTERHDDLSPDQSRKTAQVTEQVESALSDETVKKITITPRWQRRQQEWALNRRPGKRRTYH